VNPDGRRFLFFHIWLKDGRRYTRLITCNPDGTEPYALINEGHVSHYDWKSPDEVLCFSTHRDTGTRYYLYKDKTPDRQPIGEGVLGEDGHPSYAPDGKSILVDTYPDRCGDRHLILFDVDAERGFLLGKFFSPPAFSGEARCDLHPRWSPRGRLIAFDSAHERLRGIYLMDLSDLKNGKRDPQIL
jgi:Tol biopolymer transport system component